LGDIALPRESNFSQKDLNHTFLFTGQLNTYNAAAAYNLIKLFFFTICVKLSFTFLTAKNR